MSIVLSVLVGGMAGAVGLTLVTLWYHRLAFRGVLGDGQYCMIVFVTVPLGGLLGAALSCALTHLSRATGAVCLGAAALVIIGGLRQMVQGGSGQGNSAAGPFFKGLAVAAAFALPWLVFVVAVLWMGIRLVW